MPSDTLWKRLPVYDPIRLEILAEIKARHAAHNLTVTSRPVLRRQAFLGALRGINQAYGGHLRRERRLWARAAVKRVWPQLQERRREALEGRRP